jgi:hypothetical protein
MIDHRFSIDHTEKKQPSFCLSLSSGILYLAFETNTKVFFNPETSTWISVDYRGRRDVYKFVWFRSQISDKGVILVDSIDPSVGHPLQQRMRRWNRNVGYSYSSHKTLKIRKNLQVSVSGLNFFLKNVRWKLHILINSFHIGLP